MTKRMDQAERHGRAWLNTSRGDIAAMPIDAIQSLVTELQLYQAELARQNQELQRERDVAEKLLSTTPGIFVQLDAHGRILRCNRCFEQFLGYLQSEIRGLDAFELILPPAAQGPVRSRYAQSLKSPREAFMPGSSEIIPVVTRGGQERIVAWTLTPVSDEAGQSVGMLLSGIDLTERRKLEADLLQSQKMESLGQFASGIAHDFNNLLMGVTGLTEIAASRVPPQSPALPILAEIRQAASSGAALTRQLLDFARRRVVETVAVDLSRLVARAGALLRCLTPAHVELDLQLGEGVFVMGDPGQLEQVLLNLVANARDAMPGGGKLVVKTGRGELAGTPQSGDYAMLTVSDSGVGMDEATKRRVFEPFFTTKPMDAGTGLGLATVYGIVAESGGHIQLESAPGHGTTFRIFLPHSSERPESEDPQALAAVAAGCGETILVVEDEASVRSSLRHRLQRQGYKVLDVENGEQALQICRSSEPISLAITDIILPGMLGDEVARQIKQLRPGVPVLYMSAFPPDRLVREGRMPAGAASLQKPFSERELFTKVKELLTPAAVKPAAVSELSVPVAAASPAHTVLLVEDDETGRMVLQELLELAHCKVLVAERVAAARALSSTRKDFDLIIADYGLPDGNGASLMGELMAARGELRGILITGRSLRDPALAGAAQDSRLRLLRKPFEFDALLGAIGTLFPDQPAIKLSA